MWGIDGIGNQELSTKSSASNLFADTLVISSRMMVLDIIHHTVWNFGQKPFKFAPPEGFQPLNNANTRPETVITRPDQYVGITTYTGAGGTKKVDGFKF